MCVKVAGGHKGFCHFLGGGGVGGRFRKKNLVRLVGGCKPFL